MSRDLRSALAIRVTDEGVSRRTGWAAVGVSLAWLHKTSVLEEQIIL